MSFTMLTEAECRQTWEAYSEHETMKATADALGLTVKAVYLRIKRFREIHDLPPGARPLRAVWVACWDAWGEHETTRAAAAALRASSDPRWADLTHGQLHRWACAYRDAMGLPEGTTPHNLHKQAA